MRTPEQEDADICASWKHST